MGKFLSASSNVGLWTYFPSPFPCLQLSIILDSFFFLISNPSLSLHPGQNPGPSHGFPVGTCNSHLNGLPVYTRVPLKFVCGNSLLTVEELYD